MKKMIFLFLCALIAVAAFFGCSEDPADTDSGKAADSESLFESDTLPPTGDDSAGLPEYRVPADVVTIDDDAETIPEDEIKFAYDEEGRVLRYQYFIDGRKVVVTYVYMDGMVQLFAFMDEAVVANEEIYLPEYDPAVGFRTYNGYFFKGYAF